MNPPAGPGAAEQAAGSVPGAGSAGRARFCPNRGTAPSIGGGAPPLRSPSLTAPRRPENGPRRMRGPAEAGRRLGAFRRVVPDVPLERVRRVPGREVGTPVFSTGPETSPGPLPPESGPAARAAPRIPPVFRGGLRRAFFGVSLQSRNLWSRNHFACWPCGPARYPTCRSRTRPGRSARRAVFWIMAASSGRSCAQSARSDPA